MQNLNIKIAKVFQPAEFGWNFIKNLRSARYTTASLINELVDNSADAMAKKIWVHLLSDKEDPNKITSIIVADNGEGMDRETCRGSFKIGFERSNRKRKENGKFGMGGTVGCLSVCKEKLVITRHNTGVFARSYNLDQVRDENAWGSQEEEVDKSMLETLNKYIGPESTGTVIILSQLDRITNSSRTIVKSQLKKDLGLTYCEKIDSLEFEIFVNETKIISNDPMHWDNNNIERLYDQTLPGTGMRLRVVSVAGIDKGIETKVGRMTRSGGYIFRNGRLIEKNVFKSDRWPSMFDKAQNRRDCRWALYFTAKEDDIMQVSNSKDQVNPKQELSDKIGGIVKEYSMALAEKRDKRDVVPPPDQRRASTTKLEEQLSDVIQALSEEEGHVIDRSAPDNVIEVTGYVRQKPQNNKIKILSDDMKKWGPVSEIEKLLPPFDKDHGYHLTLNCANPFNVHHYNKSPIDKREAIDILVSSLMIAKIRTSDEENVWQEKFFDEFHRMVTKLTKEI
jgi:hypothetical protein